MNIKDSFNKEILSKKLSGCIINEKREPAYKPGTLFDF